MKRICQQHILQMGLYFITNIETRCRLAQDDEDDSNIMDTLQDFRSGFDRRVQLLTLNHVLLNLNKTMMDGTVYNKMLDVKNPGEWIKVTDQIIQEHFLIKNKQANFSVMEDKFNAFCKV